MNGRVAHSSPNLNAWSIENRPGNLPNATRKEFVDLMLANAHHALTMDPSAHSSELHVEFEDGRVLYFHQTVFPAQPNRNLPELREWAVHLYTLNQRTPRCLRRWHDRKAWLYIAPYTEEKGYTTDPSGLWSYKVWG